MKSNTLFLQILFAGVIFSAQAQKPKPSFTVSAGISSAMYFTDDDYGDSYSSDLHTGAYGGFTARIPTGIHWALEPGLFYVQKGGVETVTDYQTVKVKTSLNYLELPVNMYYSKRNRFFITFGPAFGFALSGQIKAEDESVKLKFGSGAEDDLKSFEIGLNFTAGYQFKNNLFLAVSSGSGISDLSNDDSYSFSNGYLGFRLGYVFAKKAEANKSSE